MIIDTNISCLNKSDFLKKQKGVTVVGRYFREKTHANWKITKPEAQELSKANIKLFVVFEDYGKKDQLVLTAAQGEADGKSALKQANDIGQPQGTPIYFAVEDCQAGISQPICPASWTTLPA